jgi:hypothetical protein
MVKISLFVFVIALAFGSASLTSSYQASSYNDLRADLVRNGLLVTADAQVSGQ